MFAENITNEEINTLELSRYEGKVTIISRTEDISVAFRKITRERVVGFDTETKPTFRRGEINEVALIQIATEKEVFLIRTHITGITDDIINFLETDTIMKVGVALRDDLKDLNRLRPFTPGGFVEINKLVKPLGIMSNGLRKLTAIILGFRVSKSAQVSNWENDQLTEKQVYYAATDAWVCIRMYNTLRAKGYLEV